MTAKTFEKLLRAKFGDDWLFATVTFSATKRRRKGVTITMDGRTFTVKGNRLVPLRVPK